MLSEVSDNTLDARTEQEIHADTDKKFSQIIIFLAIHYNALNL